MKKNIIKLLLLIFTIISSNSYCQIKANVRVLYDIEFNTDFPIKANAILYLNDSISQYQVFNRDNVVSKHDLDVFMKLNTKNNNEFLETNILKNQIKFVENILDNTYLVTENIKNINWNITTEKKTIGSFECYKAIGSFRKRTYVVYFCPELQSSFGPWKLNGLPGLILEAVELNNLLRIYIKQVDIAQNNFTFFNFNNSSKSISLKEYIKLKENLHIMITEQVNLKLPRGVKLEGISGADNQNKIEIFDESDY